MTLESYMRSVTRSVRRAFYEKKGVTKIQVANWQFLVSTRTNTKTVLRLKKHLRCGKFEPQVIEALMEHVHFGETVFEIGSWIGPYAFLMSRLVGENGRVCLFEPDPVARSSLEENLRLNSCQNCQPLPIAISDADGLTSLHNEGSYGDSMSSIIAEDRSSYTPQRNSVNPPEVATRTLDSFARTTGLWPDFVKIDVEGAEDLVIAGGQDVLSRNGVVVVVEIHSQLLKQRKILPSAIISNLRNLNKKIWLLDGSGKEVTNSSLSDFTDRARFHILAKN
jgi:FkbM family methyltransferase